MEFFLIGLPVPLIMVTDCISDFKYNSKLETISIPYVSAKFNKTAATTSSSQDFFHKCL